MSIFKKGIYCFLAAVLLCHLAGCQVQSPAPVTDNTGPVYVLKNAANHQLQQHIQVLADSEKGYTIAEITAPRMQDFFVPFPDKPFKPQSHQVYWGKIQLENRLPEAAMYQEWVLNFSSTFTQVTLYRMAENGA